METMTKPEKVKKEEPEIGKKSLLTISDDQKKEKERLDKIAETAKVVIWNYEESVEKVIILINTLQLSTDLLNELKVARSQFGNQGTRTDLLKKKNGTSVNSVIGSWEGYCEKVGIKVVTANYWLRNYDPETGEKTPEAVEKQRIAKEVRTTAKKEKAKTDKKNGVIPPLPPAAKDHKIRVNYIKKGLGDGFKKYVNAMTKTAKSKDANAWIDGVLNILSICGLKKVTLSQLMDYSRAMISLVPESSDQQIKCIPPQSK